MDKQELRLKLEEELALGQRATRAYELYIKQFLETNYRELYNAFMATDDDAQSLLFKRYIIANQELELTIIRDMNTGKRAAKQLEDSRDDLPKPN